MQNLVAFLKYFSMLKRCQIAPSGMPATRGWNEDLKLQGLDTKPT